MGKILILDGQQRNVLSCVRSLAKQGHVVDVGAHKKKALCFSSRFASGKWLYPDPTKAPNDFVNSLMEQLDGHVYDMVLPFIDATTRILVDIQKELRKYVPLLLPEKSSFDLAFDKAKTFRFAEKIGVPIPRTGYPSSLSDALNLAEAIQYPVVIKPRISSGSRGLKIVKNSKELSVYFPRIHDAYPNPILQEFIPLKEAVGFVALYGNDRKLKAFCQHKRLHEYPLSGGPSTLRATIYDKRLYEYGSSILEALDWRGSAMVEFRIDARDNIPKLMEINPRLWGSISLHIAAGVNFPELIYKEIHGIPYEPVISYPIGIKAKWLLPGEILFFLANLRRRRVRLDALKWWGDDVFLDILSKEDPLPAFTMLFNMLIALFNIQQLKHAIFRR